MYKTFLRSSTTFRQFASARKITQQRNLTYDQARDACLAYNKGRTTRQKRRGTMLEFTTE